MQHGVGSLTTLQEVRVLLYNSGLVDSPKRFITKFIQYIEVSPIKNKFDSRSNDSGNG